MSADAQPRPAVHPRPPRADGGGDDIEGVVDLFNDGMERSKVDRRCVAIQQAEIEIRIGKGRSPPS